MSRKEAREWIVKLIFQMTLNNEYKLENIESFLIHFEIDEKHRDFIISSVKSILENLETIDKKIEDNLIGWDFNRLYNIDISILRVATNELLFDDNIPSRVSINEAVEIAKKYSSEDSFKFINGVLGSIAKGDENEG